MDAPKSLGMRERRVGSLLETDNNCCRTAVLLYLRRRRRAREHVVAPRVFSAAGLDQSRDFSLSQAEQTCAGVDLCTIGARVLKQKAPATDYQYPVVFVARGYYGSGNAVRREHQQH